MRRVALVPVVVALACQPQRPPVVRDDGGGGVQVARAAVDAAARGDAPARRAELQADAAAAAEAADARREGPPRVAIERAAGLDARRVLAVGRGALYRLAGDRWARVTLEGAEPRDVVAARGALWVLAKGTGANAAHAVVLRAAGEELVAVAAPLLGAESDPRALEVVAENEFYVGGARPALAHVRGSAVDVENVTGERVLLVRRFRDETVFAVHDASRATALRYGERHAIEVGEGYLGTVTDPNGAGYVARANGLFQRVRVPELGLVMGARPPFVPRAAAALSNGRFAIAGAGGPFATIVGRGAWQVTEGALPADPVAIVPVDPPLVVGRDGAVAAVENGAVRAVVAAP